MLQSASLFVVLKPAFYAAGRISDGKLRASTPEFYSPFPHTEGVLHFKLLCF